MKKFSLFVAAIALSITFTSCVDEPLGPDEPVNSDPAEITVSPAEITTTLEGGEFQLTVISNASWCIMCDQRDVCFSPAVGSGSGVVRVSIPATTVARNFSIDFEASKDAMMEGIPYFSKATASVAVYQNANGDTSIATNVAEVRALLAAMNPGTTKVAVTDEIAAMTITGIVVGEPNGNMGNNYLFAIQDNGTAPGGGLTVNHDKAKELKKGDVVKFSLADAQVQLYAGLLQLAASNSSEFNVIGTADNLSPIVVDYADFLSYESQYVKINNVTPSTEVIGKVWNSTTKGANVNFLTANGQTLIVRVSGYASFKNDIIPSKSGALCGVAGRYNNDKQIMPQYASDIQLTEDIPTVDTMPVTIADILTGGAGTYKVENAWVAGFNGNGIILTDASGAYIYAYIYQNPHKTIGERMDIEGTVNARYGALQFNAPTITTLSGTASVTYPTPTLYTGSALEDLCNKFTTGAYLAEYASFKGVLEYDGSYYNLVFSDVDGTLYKGSLSKVPDANLGLADFNGKYITLYGFAVDYSKPYLTIIPTSVVEDNGAVVLAADAITNIPAEGVTNATHDITVIGINTVTTEIDGTVVTAASVSGNVLTYSVSANTGSAREGWIKLSAAGVESVTIVVSQNRYSSYDFMSDAAFVDSTTNYNANAKVNGSLDVNASGFKIGTGKLSGYFASQPVAVDGDLTLEFYAVAWKGKSATLYVRKQGSTELLGQFTLKANDGATNQSPYTLTLDNDNYYTVSIPGVTADTILEFATDASFEKIDNTTSGRAIVVGVHLVEGISAPVTPGGPVVNSSIIGGWHIKSYCGAPSDIDVYMQLNKDKTFELYQRSNSATYVEYSGTYTLDESKAIISGVYSDGSSWANSYNYSINANNELVFVNTNNSTEVTIYEPATMPSISTLSISRAANISNIKPL